ncbi:gp168 [Bacillus phage G]|uniref:Gp168 n=1 Tax=Bacillus phage G TaxID=2884420 RepID=G3MBN4_9CAUD|nr:gp168 [Bacillus phage G]AEO93428.1 gp168 [Bacillus phage G]
MDYKPMLIEALKEIDKWYSIRNELRLNENELFYIDFYRDIRANCSLIRSKFKSWNTVEYVSNMGYKLHSEIKEFIRLISPLIESNPAHKDKLGEIKDNLETLIVIFELSDC